MISALGLRISAVFRRTAPDPFVLAILLTLLTAILALAIGDFPGKNPEESRIAVLINVWRGDKGLWTFLAFSMQMCLILVTGHVLATTPPVRRLIDLLAGVPRSTAQAAALVAVAACGAAIINWGFGLIVGALLARAAGHSLARRGIPTHYPLIVAAGYTGLMIWHGGLSGSAPLSVTTVGAAAKTLPMPLIERLAGQPAPSAETPLIGLQETLGAPFNFFITGGILTITPLVFWLMSPRRADQMIPPPPAEPGAASADAPAASGERPTIPDLLETTPPIAWLLAFALLAGVIVYVGKAGFFSIGLNEVNMLMLALGLLLHGSIRSYAAAAEEAARGCAGIILQFPLYGGIMGMMVVSGLVGIVATKTAEISSPTTLPLLTFCSAAVLNMFVPSGGGQWGVQGPIALESAQMLGVEPGKLVMAVAYGDQLTNMLQPFWALPLLAITGVKARDIVGYTALAMLVAGAWIALGLLIF